MEYDFTNLKNEVAKVDATIEREGKVPFFGGPWLAHEIAKTLKPFLDEISLDSPQDIKDDMELLYSKAVEYAPVLSLMRIVKGQFYMSIGRPQSAEQCFREAYDIDKDPTMDVWPHLQVSRHSTGLMITLGTCLQQVGKEEEGKRFLDAARVMAEKIKSRHASFDAPTPD